MKKIFILLFASLLLSGCSSSPSEEGEPKPNDTQEGESHDAGTQGGQIDDGNEDGGLPSHSHIFNLPLTIPTALAKNASCTTQAFYYYSCACGEIDKNNVFPFGNALGHDFEYTSDGNATHLQNGTKTGICKRCGATTNEEDIGSRIEEHTFNLMNMSEEYIAHYPTCESSGLYYFSCECGEHNNETFSGPAPSGHKKSNEWSKDENGHWHTCENDPSEKLDYAEHSFDMKFRNEAALISPATCEEDAVYHYSCICGLVSESSSFIDEGSKLGHNPKSGYEISETHHWHTCENDPSEKLDYAQHNYNLQVKSDSTLVSPATCNSDAIYAKSCVCGKVSSSEFFLDVNSKKEHNFADFQEVHIENLDCVKAYGAVCENCGYGDIVFNNNVVVIKESNGKIYISDKRFDFLTQQILFAVIEEEYVNESKIYVNNAKSCFENYIVGEDYDFANQKFDGGQYTWKENSSWAKEIDLKFEFDDNSRIKKYRMEKDKKFLQYDFEYSDNIYINMTDNVDNEGNYHIGKVILNSDYQTLENDCKGYNSKGEVIGETKYVYSYDENGHVLSYETQHLDTFINDLRVVTFKEYEYDERGNLIVEQTNSFDKDTDTYYVLARNEYEYDSYGNQIKYKTYRFDNTTKELTPEYEYSYAYNINGKQIYYSYIRPSNGSGSYSKYDYDENGQLIFYESGSFVDFEERPHNKELYEYDSKGHETYVWIGFYNSLSKEFVLDHEVFSTYDSFGHCSSYEFKSSYSHYLKEYNYDPLNPKTYHEVDYVLDDGGNWVIEDIYDCANNPDTKMTTITSYGLDTEKETYYVACIAERYENDPNGNNYSNIKYYSVDGGLSKHRYHKVDTNEQTHTRTSITYDSSNQANCSKLIEVDRENNGGRPFEYCVEKYRYKYNGDKDSIEFQNKFILDQKEINDYTYGISKPNSIVYKNVGGEVENLLIISKKVTEVIDEITYYTQYEYSEEKGELVGVSKSGSKYSNSSEVISNTEESAVDFPTIIIYKNESEVYQFTYDESLNDFILKGKQVTITDRYSYQAVAPEPQLERFLTASMDFYGNKIDQSSPEAAIRRTVTTCENYHYDNEKFVLYSKQIDDDYEDFRSSGIMRQSHVGFSYDEEGNIKSGSKHENIDACKSIIIQNDGDDKELYPNIKITENINDQMHYKYKVSKNEFVIEPESSYRKHNFRYYKIDIKGKENLYMQIDTKYDSLWEENGQIKYVLEKVHDERFPQYEFVYLVSKYDVDTGKLLKEDISESEPSSLNRNGDLGSYTYVDKKAYLVGTGFVNYKYTETMINLGKKTQENFIIYNGDQEFFLDTVDSINLKTTSYQYNESGVQLVFGNDFDFNNLKNVLIECKYITDEAQMEITDFEVNESGLIKINHKLDNDRSKFSITFRNSNNKVIRTISIYPPTPKPNE